ncbi:MAG: outer membrane protein assembly factor BamA [Planctomycetota bacterium]
MVKEIAWEGNLRNEADLETLIQTKEGQILSQAVLAEDVSTLLGFYESVTTREEPVSGGVRIVFVVQEYPVLSSVVFRGFEDLDEDDFEEMEKSLRTQKWHAFAEYTVQLDRGRIEEYLRRKGYYFAEVRASQGAYRGGRQVLFTAIMGPEVTIDDIRFEGNVYFGEGDLDDWMLSRENGFWELGRFDRRKLDQDLIMIAKKYRSEGFLDATVELKDLSFSADKEEVTITIGVQENQAYRIESVVIEGGGTFPEDHAELRELVRMEPGDRRREEDIFTDLARLQRFYLEHAYFNCRVQRVTSDDPRTRKTKIKFVITEGKPVRVRRVDITGNAVTRDRVVRRNLGVHPGGPLNSVELAKSRSRLEATGFFEMGSVNTVVKDTDDPGWKDVLVDLREGRTGSLRFSAGVNSDLGLVALIAFKKKNFDYADVPERFAKFFEGTAFTGGGQTLDLILQPGNNYATYKLAFTEPWFLDHYLITGPAEEFEETPWSFGVDLVHTRFSRFNYDSGRTGFGFSTGKAWRNPERRFDDVIRASTSFRIENVRIDGLGTDSPPNAYLFKGLTRENRMGFGLSWARVDLPASPGRGFLTDIGFDLAGGPFGGEVDYWKVQAGITQFNTLWTDRKERRHLLELKFRIGGSKPYGSSDQVPPFDRFYAGGRNTIRGFEYGTVGPRAEGNPNTNRGRQKIERSLRSGDGDPMGGETMWLFRSQYGFPVYDQFLRGVVFVDGGNTADNWNTNLWTRTRVAAGFGIRVKVPFFGPTPLAFDFAWPLRDEEGDDLQVISFSIDRPF